LDDQRIQILIVDDDLELLWMYKELFELEGFKVHIASSGMEAIEIFKKHQDIKLIISDSTMEPMSGMDFLEYMTKTYQTIPIFYLATGDINKSGEYIKSKGGHRLVLKPFDLDEIFIKIRQDLNL